MRLKLLHLLPVIPTLAVVLPSMVSAQGQVPTGYYLAPATPLPDSLTEIRGQFTMQVVRSTTDSPARRALLLAESVFPDPKTIELAASRETRPPVQARLRQAAALPGNRWWWDDFDAVLTPYALTGAAVDYYLNRMRARSDSANPFVNYSEGLPHRGSFQYSATVSAAADSSAAAGGHVVRMTLRWQYYCGRLCGVYFGATREVLISRDGRVVEVRGDQRPQLVVS